MAMPADPPRRPIYRPTVIRRSPANNSSSVILVLAAAAVTFRRPIENHLRHPVASAPADHRCLHRQRRTDGICRRRLAVVPACHHPTLTTPTHRIRPPLRAAITTTRRRYVRPTIRHRRITVSYRVAATTVAAMRVAVAAHRRAVPVADLTPPCLVGPRAPRPGVTRRLLRLVVPGEEEGRPIPRPLLIRIAGEAAYRK